MKVASLSGSLRESVGKKSSKALRNNGQVPCVLYGHGEQVSFSADLRDANKLVYTPYVYKVVIDINGKKYDAIIQDLQQDPVTNEIMHIDFLQLSDDKEVRISLPIKLLGTARGILSGGKLSTPFRKLRIVGLPKDLPDFIEIDVTKLRIGQGIRIHDLKVEGIRFREAANAVVVAVRIARGAVADDGDDDDEEEAK